MAKNRKKTAIGIGLERALELPAGFLEPLSFVTVGEDGSVSVSRCYSVLTYTPQRILLRLSQSFLSVYGTDLTLHSYCDGHITIHGRVGGVSFEEEAPC